MLQVENAITINASVAKVWDVLVNPEMTKVYMFGCEAISAWKVGSSLVWKMNHEGKEFIPVKGFIKSIIPNELLRYTVIDPNADMEDIPENYLNVTYRLVENGGGTELTVTQDGFEKAADGMKRYKDVYNNGQGWDSILTQIKKVAETV